MPARLRRRPGCSFLERGHPVHELSAPTYIYGPGNYNPVESWFFDRITHGRPVPLPGDGSTITHLLGHVNDLAAAMAISLEVDAATNRIYNCSGARANR